MTDSQSGLGAEGSARGAPLSGKRVWITRSPERAEPVASALRELGAEVLVAATTAIVDIDAPAVAALVGALRSPSSYDWILFTSANGVRACARYLQESGTDCSVLSSLKIAAMGEATGAALAAVGLTATIQETGGTSEDLALSLLAAAAPVAPRVLYPRARTGREEALNLLRASGSHVGAYPAYASVTIQESDPAWLKVSAELRNNRLNAVAFFAPSQFLALQELDPEAVTALGKLEVIAAIGSTTANELQKAGVLANALATTPNAQDIVDKILQAFS